MTEPTGQVAGRLSVVVEASLANFRRELKKQVEEKSKGIKAQIGVEVNTKGLRKMLEEKVAEASKGITAEVGIDLDSKTLKARVEAAAKAAASNVTLTVDVDDKAAEAQTTGLKRRVQAWFARGRDVEVPITGDDRGVTGDALRAQGLAQAAVDGAGGVKVPVSVDDKGSASLARGMRMRSLLKGSALFGIVSLLEPAVGAIGQVVAGLTSMVGAAAPAVGTLAAIPITLAAIVQGALGGKLALQGVGDAMGLLAEKQATLARGETFTTAQQEKLDQVLKELAPSAAAVAKEVVGLRGAWVQMRKGVQEKLFSRIKGDVKELAHDWLPLLEKRLSGTAARLGDAAHAVALWAETGKAQSDTGKVMKNNNVILSDGIYMMGQFGQGALDLLVSSRRFGRDFGDNMRGLGDWFSGKAAAGRKSGSTADFLDTASKKASQLWDITKKIGSGLHGIFVAGTGSGNRLLDTFDGFLGRWDSWVNSESGQKYLTDWFEGTEKGFIAASRLINSAFKGAAKWAADPKIAGLLDQLRTELGPALGDFLKLLSDDAAPGVIDLLTELVRGIKHLEPAVETISLLTNAITGLLGVLNDLADWQPGTMDAIAKVLGGLVLISSVGRLTKVTSTLLGLSKGSKGLGAAGAEAGAAAVGYGKLGASLGKFAKSPLLKKAGWIGLALTALDATNALKDAYTFGQNFGEQILAGYSDGMHTPSAKTAFAQAWVELMAGGDKSASPTDALWGDGDDAAEGFKTFKIDQERLASEMQKYGSKSGYYKEVIAQLTDVTKGWHGAVADATQNWMPFWDGQGEQANRVLDMIETAGEQVDDAIAATKENNRKRRTLEKLLNDPGSLLDNMPKQVSAPGGNAFNWFKPPKPPKPSMPPENPFGMFKPPKVSVVPKNIFAAFRPPDPKPSDTKKWRDLYVKTLPDVVRKGVGKIKGATRGLPKIFDNLNPSLRRITRVPEQWGASFQRAGRKVRQASTDASKSVTRMSKEVSNKTKSIEKDVSKAMDGVVKAVRSKQAPAKTASGKVATGIKEPLNKLNGPLETAGTDAMNGFALGIRTAGATAVADARSIAAQVAAATRKALDIHSPSKVMQKLGAWVSEGFAKGIRGGLKKVQNAQEGLWKHLTDRGISQKRIGAMKARFADEFKAIKDAAKKRDALSDRLDRAQNKVARLTSERATLKSSLKSGAEEYGDVGAIAQANGGFANVQWMISELTTRAKNSKMFRKVINRLRKKGLGKRAIQQIIDLGMEDGLPIAQQLVQGSSAEITKINKLQGVIADQAKKLGKATSKAFWDSGIKAGHALVHSLKARQKELNKIAEHMGTALVRAIRAALGLKNPTKKGKASAGGNSGGGTPGTNKGGGPGSAGGAVRAAARAAVAASGPKTKPKGGAGALRSSRGETAAAATASTAPLVGELHLHGVKDAGAVRPLLEESYFQLLRIRQGGLYAYHVA